MPTQPQDRKPKAPKPSEVLDAQREREAARQELLGDMPALKPATQFRFAERNVFNDLSLTAAADGVFDKVEFDISSKDGIEGYRKFTAFLEAVDVWAESIAEDSEAYAEWAKGKTEEHILAILTWYQEQMGESKRSEN